MFKELVKREEKFDLISDSYGTEILIHYDVWDLINNLIDLIKQSVQDPYYLPEIHPITKVLEDLERTELDTRNWLDTEIAEKAADSNKRSGNNYMVNIYTEDLTRIKDNISIVKEYISSGEVYSSFEVSAGNDGNISGSYGYAMEEMRPKFDDGEFYIIIENNH